MKNEKGRRGEFEFFMLTDLKTLKEFDWILLFES